MVLTALETGQLRWVAACSGSGSGSGGNPPSILTRTAHTAEGSLGHRGGGRHVAGVDLGVDHGVPGEADTAAKGSP